VYFVNARKKIKRDKNSVRKIPRTVVRGKLLLRWLEILTKLLVEPVEVIGLVDSINTACACAGVIERIGGHAYDHIGILEEYGTTRVAKTCAARMRIVS
jgi:hypothetical protein